MSENSTSDSWRLVSYSVFGEDATTPAADNLLGQLWQQYDESGKIQMDAFDFKGNLLSKSQQVISSATLKSSLDNYNTYLVDWTGLPSILDSNAFVTDNEYDALNRSTKVTLPGKLPHICSLPKNVAFPKIRQGLNIINS